MGRMVFLGTPAAAVPSLRALAERAEVALVITREDRRRGRSGRKTPSEVKKAALKLGLATACPADRAELGEALKSAGSFQLGVVVAYGMLLTRSMLDCAASGFVNVHFSLLPRWRGAAPVAAAIRAGDAVTGVSLMRVTEGLDAGPVLAAIAHPIGEQDTRGDLTERLSHMGAELLVGNLAAALSEELAGTPQHEPDATYAPMLTTEDASLDLARPAEALARQVRAMSPRPGAFAWWGETRLRILDARWAPSAPLPLRVGELAAAEGRLWCGAGSGVLVLESIQPPGKRAMPGAAWARGVRRRLGFLTRG